MLSASIGIAPLIGVSRMLIPEIWLTPPDPKGERAPSPIVSVSLTNEDAAASWRIETSRSSFAGMLTTPRIWPSAVSDHTTAPFVAAPPAPPGTNTAVSPPGGTTGRTGGDVGDRGNGSGARAVCPGRPVSFVSGGDVV